MKSYKEFASGDYHHILAYKGAKHERNAMTVRSTSELFLMICDEKRNGLKSEVAHAKILEHMRTFLSGYEPCMDARINWSYPAFSGCIAVARNTDTIWNEFTDGEKAKFTLLMKCLTVITSFISNDLSAYKTGIGLEGDVFKGWNPNVQISVVAPMIFCYAFFGGTEVVDSILESFDYEATLSEIHLSGFQNMEKVWTTPGFSYNGEECPGAKELLLDGGKAFILDKFGNRFPAGSGKTVKRPYAFEGNIAPDEIFQNLAERCYSGGTIKSETEYDGYHCYILDGTRSPAEGKEGMFLEFDQKKGQYRSCVGHSSICFSMMTACLYGLDTLGLYQPNQYPTLFEKIRNGNEDLFYKTEHGWHSVDRGVETDSLLHLANDYDIYRAIWDEYYTKEA